MIVNFKIISIASNQKIIENSQQNVEVWMKRLDQLGSEAMGNKIFKLKYNLEEARGLGYDTVLTFGGAFSNHITAVAVEGRRQGFKTIGVIRGEELGDDLEKTLQFNPTLNLAFQNKMQFDFISRADYRLKDERSFKAEMIKKYGRVYILPEGGTNQLAVKGCEEILTKEDRDFDVICCPVGTGGTLAGIINSSSQDQKVIGFSALNVDLEKQILPYVNKSNWKLIKDSYFGGFAKINKELVSFINSYTSKGVQLDPIYTGKMMFALEQMIKSGFFPKNSRILSIHTGGLQGILGMNKVLKKKGLLLIKEKK